MKYLMDKETNHQCLFEATVNKQVNLLAEPSVIERIDAEYRTMTTEIIQMANFFKIY